MTIKAEYRVPYALDAIMPKTLHRASSTEAPEWI